MQIPDEIRLGIEIGSILIGLSVSAGVTLVRLGRLGQQFDYHAAELKEAKVAIDKIEDTLQVVAVQNAAIQSIRDAQLQDRNRIDQTFKEIKEDMRDMKRQFAGAA
jgi:hypothetical protein